MGYEHSVCDEVIGYGFIFSIVVEGVFMLSMRKLCVTYSLFHYIYCFISYIAFRSLRFVVFCPTLILGFRKTLSTFLQIS